MGDASLGSAHSDEAAALATLSGTHPGAVMAGARILARPARHPAGLWSSLRAPLVAPEPALVQESAGSSLQWRTAPGA